MDVLSTFKKIVDVIFQNKKFAANKSKENCTSQLSILLATNKVQKQHFCLHLFCSDKNSFFHQKSSYVINGGVV